MKQHIFLASPHMSDEGYEQAYIKEAFATNWIAPLGKNVTEFEKEMVDKLGAGAAVALSAGTAAVHMALKSIGVGVGDIVFCQSLTFSATATVTPSFNLTGYFPARDIIQSSLLLYNLTQNFTTDIHQAGLVISHNSIWCRYNCNTQTI